MTTDEIIDAYNTDRIGFEKMVKLIEDDHAPTCAGSQWDTSVDKIIHKGFPKLASGELRQYVPTGNEFELIHYTDPDYRIGDYIKSGIKDDAGRVYIHSGYAAVIGKTRITHAPNCNIHTYYTNVIVLANVK